MPRNVILIVVKSGICPPDGFVSNCDVRLHEGMCVPVFYVNIESTVIIVNFLSVL